jgi:hypothetical protein
MRGISGSFDWRFPVKEQEALFLGEKFSRLNECKNNLTQSFVN